MNLPAQIQPRLLPFDRESPGAWQRWEGFWVDFLNSNPLLPWPGKPPRFKRSTLAEPRGVGGGKQDGIDMQADMDDGSILAVQCKDWKDVDCKKAVMAMDKAEREFQEAQAYFLVFTAKDIPADLQTEADRRGNWRVIGRETLSSWFFAGKFLDVDAQKRLVQRHFDTVWLKAIFPQPWDELLISPTKFFNSKSLIHHDAQLQGKPFNELVESLADAIGEGKPRISILSAPGGQGKTRLLKAVAEKVESRYPQRKVRFLNDEADANAEDYGVRGNDFKNLCLFIDDAHRLENVRKRLLSIMQESGAASALIATRPNNIQALLTRLEKCGFREGDWQKHEVPVLDYAGRRALAVEILGSDDGETPDFLAKESECCPLICTVGADLIRSGGIGVEVLKSEEFRRRVFDYLMVSSLDHLFADDPEYRKISERCLRAISLISPLEKSDKAVDLIARAIERKATDVDPILALLGEIGLLRSSRRMWRVAPDLLSDHLAYETAYGNDTYHTLVRNLIQNADETGFTMIFANLAEAEWRAKQENRSDAFLHQMWESFREILRDPEDRRIHGLLDTWRKIAIFQPERTLELAEMILDYEMHRILKNTPAHSHKGERYDSIALHLGTLPDILAPVASQHSEHRSAAIDLLWRIGLCEDGPSDPRNEIPKAWQVISSAADIAHWDTESPQDIFAWLQSWVQSGDGKQVLEKGGVFLKRVAIQWFISHDWGWERVPDIPESPTEIDGFCLEVLEWIDSEIIPMGSGPTWAILAVIFAACRTPSASVRSRAQGLLRRILETHDDPLIRVSIWHHLSEQVANEELDEWKKQWLALRESITLDLSFKLVRLASWNARQEWNHEHMLRWEHVEDSTIIGQWWQKLSLATTVELRRSYPRLQESMARIDLAHRLPEKFRQQSSWDIIADAWSRSFPEEREEVLKWLMEHPDHALIPCLGYFIGLRDETDGEWAEQQFLAALAHADARVRTAALRRLSWRDVRRRGRIAAKMKEIAASSDPEVLSSITWFVSWNQYDANPYLDDVLPALNYQALADSDLTRTIESVASLVKYAKHNIRPTALDLLFRRLEQVKDLNLGFQDHALAIFHEKFPLEMFVLHRARARAGAFTPQMFDGWCLSGLPEKLGGEEFEKIARDLLEESIRSDDCHFTQFGKLFDVSVALVDPRLAASLLGEKFRQSPQNEDSLSRIIGLTGQGHGSVVYEAPDFTKELLREITRLPKSHQKDLRRQLVFAAVPHMVGYSGGRIGEDYLWAKKKAAPLAEHFRSDPLLRDFYLQIVKFQEDNDARVRRRFIDEE